MHVNDDELGTADPLADTSIEVEVPPELMNFAPGIIGLEDGSVEVNFGSTPSMTNPLDPVIPHEANLAEHLGDEVLNALGMDLINAADEDEKSYADWQEMCLKGIALLGFKLEEKTYPFKGSCAAFDSLLAESVIRFQATARGEMLPPDGPVKAKIVGTPTEAIEQQAERVKSFMNLYLTEISPEYYESTDQMLLWLGAIGSTFKKVYQDPVLGLARSDFVTPFQLVVNNSTTSLETCGRITHKIPMNGRELKQRQLNGFYLNEELNPSNALQKSDATKEVSFQVGVDPDVRPSTSSKLVVDEEYEIYEVHVDLDLEDFEHKDANGVETGLPLPYIVSVDKESKKVLSVYRNWEPNDKLYKKIEYFVHNKFIPGFGFYGLGYAHILGSNADARTKILRQLVDSGTFANFPGGVRAKGFRFENNNLAIAPGEFPEVDTGGMPISQVFMTLPYKEPSPMLFQISQAMGEQTRQLASMADIAVGDGRQDAPVGTTMALLEAATKVQSAVLKRLHVSFRKEFKLFARLFGKYLEEKPYPFRVEGGDQTVMRSDFDGRIDVIPVSDPNITSSAQRMMRTEQVLRIVQSLQPNIPAYQREAVKMLFIQMGIDKPDALLPPLPQEAQPLDPLSENQNALMGMPLKAGAYQDHDAHIAAHNPLAEQNPLLAAHIQEHVALKYRIMVEQQLGQALPPQGQPLPPEIENQIALMVAQATQQMQQDAQQPGQPTTPVVDPGFAMLQETAAKAEAAKIKAEVDMAKIQADMTKERIKSDDRSAQTAANLQIAKMRAVTDLLTDNTSGDKPLPPEVR